MKLFGILASLLLVLHSLTAGAEIHRCIGADGTMAFSDVPCGKTATTFKPLKPAASPDQAPGTDRRERLLRAFDEERQIEQEKEAEAKALRMERARKCLHAREQLRVVNQAGRIYNVDEDGNRVVQSDEARTATVEKAQGYVDYWCD